jgi:hypothetical protein
MTVTVENTQESPYQRAVLASKKARWEIERDVLRGRTLDIAHKYLPDRLSKVNTLAFLSERERKFMSQVQGRSYANIFGLVERFVSAKVLELSQRHVLGDQVALEGLVRFSDEELKHQALFRKVEQLAAESMPPGYTFAPEPNAVAKVVLERSTWAVLALTCHIELFTLAHYKHSIEPDAELSPLWKDVFLFHWKEESQHAIFDELEWRREDQQLNAEQRDRAVDDLIALVGAVDGILQLQARADTEYFIAASERAFTPEERASLHTTVLAAYRYQYFVSGLELTRFPNILFGLVSDAQRARIQAALAPLM